MASLANVSFTQPKISTDDSLLVALFLAGVIHILLFLGVSFAAPKAEKFHKQIEITLANIATKKAPKKAKYLAQDNQVGAGTQSKKPTPPKQKIASAGTSRYKKPAPRKSQKASQAKAAKKLMVQKQAALKIATNKQKKVAIKKQRPKISAESLQRQITQLGAKIRHSRKSAEKTKIKFVNSVSTHKYVAAQYMKDWEDKIERTGNLNYPDVAKKKGFRGTLTMDVGIKPNGSIYSIRITQSSGNKALDAAAVRIVRLSAPFAVLPKDLLKELDVLVIPRVWKFSDESGITTR